MILDGRHRWGPVEQDGGRIRRTCSACGRVDTYEVMIPNAVIDGLMRAMARPSIYRTMLR